MYKFKFYNIYHKLKTQLILTLYRINYKPPSYYDD